MVLIVLAIVLILAGLEVLVLAVVRLVLLLVGETVGSVQVHKAHLILGFLEGGHGFAKSK